MRRRLVCVTAFLSLVLSPVIASALDVQATATALRLANSITGGLMPTSDPLFAQMVSQVQAGNVKGAAQTAANSKYFASYLGRRLALQMQSPTLDASSVSDSDATAFLIAHFVGTKTTPPSISKIWSENATYMVSVVRNGAAVQVSAALMTPAEKLAVDWSNDLVRVDGQTVRFANTGGAAVTFTPGTLPPKHVGGYTTLSSRVSANSFLDNSFAQYGALAGTNLRFIEGIFNVATGLELMDFASSDTYVRYAPRFIAQNDPNFREGKGQPACMSCHGGGLASLHHGYSTVADTFNYDQANGLIYYPNPTTATRKSLGSDATKRQATLTCNTADAVCNPDAPAGVDVNQSWDIGRTWSSIGVLNRMGWTGATSGQGLNELGVALGKATIVYEQLTKRVINDVCPLGVFLQSEVTKIAAAANPYATPAGSDDVRTIVAQVAAHPSCL